MRIRSPEPAEGRKHIDVQTELYLEEITGHFIECDFVPISFVTNLILYQHLISNRSTMKCYLAYKVKPSFTIFIYLLTFPHQFNML